MSDLLTAFYQGELFQKISSAVLIIAIGVLVSRIVLKVLSKTLEKSTLEKAAFSLVTSLTKVILYLLIGLSAASALGIDVTGVVALASVLTLALSLALQNMVANVIGGFTILYTQPFRSGDYVEIAGQGGTVREINMAYTVLSTPDNKLVSIPNSAVVAAQIINYSTMETRRVEVVVSASCEVPTQKVIDALVLAGTVDNALLDPAPAAVITGYAEGCITYSLRIWTKTENYWSVFFLVNQRVKSIFDEQGITMTYSHLNVHLQNK